MPGFIDDTPEFVFVPADLVQSQVATTGAISYDVPDVELTHDGPQLVEVGACGKMKDLGRATIDKAPKRVAFVLISTP